MNPPVKGVSATDTSVVVPPERSYTSDTVLVSSLVSCSLVQKKARVPSAETALFWSHTGTAFCSTSNGPLPLIAPAETSLVCPAVRS